MTGVTQCQPRNEHSILQRLQKRLPNRQSITLHVLFCFHFLLAVGLLISIAHASLLHGIIQDRTSVNTAGFDVLRNRPLKFYPDFQCPPVEDCTIPGSYLYAYKPDCNAYIKCITVNNKQERRPKLFLCRETQYWDDTEKKCVDDIEHNCPKLRYWCPAHDVFSRGCNGPQCLHIHPAACDRFIRCNRGEAYDKQCPAGLEWNDVGKKCDLPALSTCSARELGSTRQL